MNRHTLCSSHTHTVGFVNISAVCSFFVPNPSYTTYYTLVCYCHHLYRWISRSCVAFFQTWHFHPSRNQLVLRSSLCPETQRQTDGDQDEASCIIETLPRGDCWVEKINGRMDGWTPLRKPEAVCTVIGFPVLFNAWNYAYERCVLIGRQHL